MIDQLIIGDKASFDDFGASLAKRTIGQPRKKTVKETVPYSNITHDFTAINGEIYWEERELQYVLEMIAPTPEKLEDMKTELSAWLMNIISGELHDPFIPDYHFLATYDDMSFDDDEGLDKTTATVKFTAYPYKIANFPYIQEIVITEHDTELVAWVFNGSSHRITPTLSVTSASGSCEIGIFTDNAILYVTNGTAEYAELMLERGQNRFIFNNMFGYNCNVTISFSEEVL